MVAAVTVKRNGKAEMAYVGETPWHGLGNALTPEASLETWQLEAGLDWKVQRSKVRYATGHGDKGLLTLDDTHVLFRSDTKAALGVVSEKYKIVQPAQVIEFFRDLVEFNHFKLTTAGTLFGGRYLWAQADIGDESSILDKKDKVKGKVLLTTSTDGSRKTVAKFVSERVVCFNTLSMALGENGKQRAVTHRSEFKADDVKTDLGIAHGAFAQFIKNAKTLAQVPVSEAMVRNLNIQLLEEDHNRLTADQVQKVMESKAYQGVLKLFNGDAKGSTLTGVKGTAWGWLNAVTEYVDHHRDSRTQDRQLFNAWIGKGDTMKTQALDLALELTK